jgi:hypothetical protein
VSLTRIDPETAINLDAVASVKFAGSADQLSATVKFLTVAPGTDSFVSETLSGEAARRLYNIIGEGVAAEVTMSTRPSQFVRTKAWYFYTDADGRRYFIAFINAKGSCSMRTFDAESGMFITKKYSAGNYQDQFGDVIQKATELTLEAQPNLERDCRVRLPDYILPQLKKQVK